MFSVLFVANGEAALSARATETLTPCRTFQPCPPCSCQERAEDFEAEEPELAEADAIRGRQNVADLKGTAAVARLLESSNASVLCGAANALFNLTLLAENADSLLDLDALGKVTAHLDHKEPAVQAAMAGVLMNCCATSVRCREQLSARGLLGVVLPLLERAMDAQEKEVLKNSLGTLNNLLLDKSAAIRRTADRCLDVVIEMDEVWAAQIRQRKFEMHNKVRSGRGGEGEKEDRGWVKMKVGEGRGVGG